MKELTQTERYEWGIGSYHNKLGRNGWSIWCWARKKRNGWLSVFSTQL